MRVRQCGSYKKERESGGEEAVNFLRTNIGNVKNVNSVLRREIRVFDKSKSIFDFREIRVFMHRISMASRAFLDRH